MKYDLEGSLELFEFLLAILGIFKNDFKILCYCNVDTFGDDAKKQNTI